MKALVVDASVRVSRPIEVDEHHPAVCRFPEGRRAAGSLFLAPALLLPEVAGAVARRTGAAALARRAVKALVGLPEIGIVALDGPLVRDAARLAGDLGLRGAGSFYVAAAARLRVGLATLDTDQRVHAAARVEVPVP